MTTLTDGLTKLPRASDIDRAATTPSLFPTSLAGDIKAVLSELAETQLPALQRRLEMEERRAEELSRPSDERVRQQLDDAVSIMVAAGVTSGDEYERQVQRRCSGSSLGVATRATSPASLPTKATTGWICAKNSAKRA